MCSKYITSVYLGNRLSEKIGTFIQNNVLEEGHDSAADARAALDLVRWRVKADVSAGLLV